MTMTYARSTWLPRFLRALQLAIAVLAALALNTTPGRAGTWYVAPTQAGSGGGWGAEATLQSALNQALPNDEIWMKAGTYTAPAGGFQVQTPVSIYGGFAGTELTIDQRSGNATILDGNGTSKHVVQIFGGYGSFTVLIDRVEVKRGNANGAAGTGNESGGGIYSSYCDLDLVDCLIDANSANYFGGGIYFTASLEQFRVLNLKRCGIIGNASGCTAEGGPVGDGGGIFGEFMRGRAVSTTFSKNTTYLHGGAVYFRDFQANQPFEFDNCQFWANQATDTQGSRAGAIYLTAQQLAGAWVIINSSTFADNYSVKCVDGQALTCDGQLSWASARNSIFYFNYLNCTNSRPLVGLSGIPGQVTYSWCDVEDPSGSMSNGNINVDPLFKNHSVGRLRLKPTSQCIDSGNGGLLPPDALDVDGDGNTTEVLPWDIEDTTRVVDFPPQGGAGVSPYVDMGAYETTP